MRQRCFKAAILSLLVVGASSCASDGSPTSLQSNEQSAANAASQSGNLGATDAAQVHYHGCMVYDGDPSRAQIRALGDRIESTMSSPDLPQYAQIADLEGLFDESVKPNAFTMLESAPKGAATDYLRQYCDLVAGDPIHNDLFGPDADSRLALGLMHCKSINQIATNGYPGMEAQNRSKQEMIDWVVYAIGGKTYQISIDTVCKGTL